MKGQVGGLFSRAKNAMKLGEYKLAERLLLELIRLAPGSSLAHTLLGNVYELSGESDSAFVQYKKAISIKPDNAEAYNNLGIVLKKKKSYSEAVKAMEKALSMAGERADIRYNLGNVFKESKDPERAIEEYRRAIKLDPSFALAYNNLGIVFESLGKLADAQSAYKRGLNADANNPRLRSNLAVILEKQGNLGRARSELERAARSSPGRIDIMQRLASLLARLGKHREAISVYNGLLKLDPQNAAAINNLGTEYVKANDLAKAFSCYELALEMDPGYMKAHFNLGSILLEGGYYLEAISEIRKVLDANPDDLKAGFELGNAYLSIGRFDDAKNTFLAVLAKSPRDERVLRALGNLSLKLGQYEDADRYFDKASNLKDTGSGFKVGFSKALSSKEAFASSKEDISSFLKEHPEDAQSETLFAELCMKNGETEKAKTALESAIDKKPDLVAPYYLLAKIHKESGNLKKSLSVLDSLISIHGTRSSSYDLLSLNAALSLYEDVAAQFDRDERLYEKRAYAVDDLRSDEDALEQGRSASDSLFAAEKERSPDAAIIKVGGMEPVIPVKEEEQVLRIERVSPGQGSVVTIEDREPPPFAELLRNQVLYDELEKLTEWAERHKRRRFIDVFGSGGALDEEEYKAEKPGRKKHEPRNAAHNLPSTMDAIEDDSKPDELDPEQQNIVDKVMDGMEKIISELYAKRAALKPGLEERELRRRKKKKKHERKDTASGLLLEQQKKEREEEKKNDVAAASDLREQLREYIRRIRKKLDSDSPIAIPEDEKEREKIKRLVSDIQEAPAYGEQKPGITGGISFEDRVSKSGKIRIEEESESTGLKTGQEKDKGTIGAQVREDVIKSQKVKKRGQRRIARGLLSALSKILFFIPFRGVRTHLRERIGKMIERIREQ